MLAIVRTRGRLKFSQDSPSQCQRFLSVVQHRYNHLLRQLCQICYMQTALSWFEPRHQSRWVLCTYGLFYVLPCSCKCLLLACTFFFDPIHLLWSRLLQPREESDLVIHNLAFCVLVHMCPAMHICSLIEKPVIVQTTLEYSVGRWLSALLECLMRVQRQNIQHV